MDSAEGRRDEDEPVERGMLDRRPRRGAAAERIAHEGDLFEAEMADERGDVLAHGFVPYRPGCVRSAAMRLQVGGDHLTRRREAPDDRPSPPCRRIRGSPVPYVA